MSLKAPVTLDALMAEWSKDSVMNKSEPGEEMMKISVLHAKYLNICSHHSILTKHAMMTYKKHRQIMFDYYEGSLNNPEDLEKYGLEPSPKRHLKSQIPDILDADEELNKILMKKMIHEEIVDFCKSVIKELNNRVWELRYFIEWEKLTPA